MKGRSFAEVSKNLGKKIGYKKDKSYKKNNDANKIFV